jgi:hypothetical protein
MMAGREDLQINIVGTWCSQHTQSLDSARGEEGERHMKKSTLDPLIMNLDAHTVGHEGLSMTHPCL